MALNPDYVGKQYPPLPAYEVGREKVREFATAVGEGSPLCHDVAAARAAGYPDVIAPPTFAFVLSMKAMAGAMFDPDLGLDYSRVVHGEQRFDHRRPIHAGDSIVVSARIADITQRGSNEFLTTECRLTDNDGHLVALTNEVIVSRGTAGGSQ